MRTYEVPRNEWRTFFNDFSREYQGWTVEIEVFDPEIGAQVEAHELPLEGILTELKDNGLDEIAIIVGAAPSDHLTHTIVAPMHVSVEKTD